MEKKFFEEPSVQKVEFEFKERIAASGCGYVSSYTDPSDPQFSGSCMNL